MLTCFSLNHPATTEIYTLSLHDALPICPPTEAMANLDARSTGHGVRSTQRSALLLPQGFLASRSEEHTSELQSHSDLVCRLLLEKKKKYKTLKRHRNITDACNSYRH